MDWTVGRAQGRLNIALFQTWYSDIQLGQIIPGTAQTVTANLADARIRGIEVEASLRPTPWFMLDGNVAYTDGRYTRWSEQTSCAAQFWRPQCVGLPGTTTITIDHANGRLQLAGQELLFNPDRFANTSKWQWSVRPTLVLKPLLGEDIRISANIYGRTAYVDATAVANSSKIAGLPSAPLLTVFGNETTDPYTAPGYGLVDLRIDWQRVGGSRLSLGFGVTNLTDKVYRVSSASAFEIIGAVYSLVGEPRMFFVSARRSF
jgi:iron complex outermembrane recepter protein